VYFLCIRFVADHFQYLASLKHHCPDGGRHRAGIGRSQNPARRIGFAGSILLVAILATLSWRQSQMYANSIVLYQATLTRTPLLDGTQ